MPAEMFRSGDFIPDFTAASTVNERFNFGTLAGNRVLLCVIGSDEPAMRVMAAVARLRRLCRERGALLLFLSDAADPDRREAMASLAGGAVVLWSDESIATRLRLAQHGCGTFLLDRNLQVIAFVPADGTDPNVEALTRLLGALPVPPRPQMMTSSAPILLVPNAFDQSLCRRLIDHYEAVGGRRSGFMRQIDGRTVGVQDDGFKRRSDVHITDEALRLEIRRSLVSRVLPQIEKAFAFRATRIERYVVACYDGVEAGRFRAHRDNTTAGTAHRQFAISLNLNAEEYQGGQLRFAEHSHDLFRPASGTACVFSCSLLHEAMPVESGRRFAFLTFVYDDRRAQVRNNNRHLVARRRVEAPTDEAAETE